MLSYLAYIASVLLLPLLLGVESVLYTYDYAKSMFDDNGKLITPWRNAFVLERNDVFPPLIQSSPGEGNPYHGIEVYDWMRKNQRDRELYDELDFQLTFSSRGEGNAAIEAAKSLKQFKDMIELDTRFFYEVQFPFMAKMGTETVRLAYWTNFIYFEAKPEVGFYLQGEDGLAAVTRNDYLLSAMGLLMTWKLHEEKLKENGLPPPVKRSSIGFPLSKESIEIVKKINNQAGKTKERVYTVSPADQSAQSDPFMSLLDLPEAWVVAISLKIQPTMFAANITEITVLQDGYDSDDDSEEYEAQPRSILFRSGCN